MPERLEFGGGKHVTMQRRAVLRELIVLRLEVFILSSQIAAESQRVRLQLCNELSNSRCVGSRKPFVAQNNRVAARSADLSSEGRPNPVRRKSGSRFSFPKTVFRGKPRFPPDPGGRVVDPLLSKGSPIVPEELLDRRCSGLEPSAVDYDSRHASTPLGN